MVAIQEAFAVLPAADRERARRWYSEKVGIEPLADVVGGYVYQVGSSRFYLYESAHAGTARSTVAGFVVDDLDATMRELRDRGVRFEDYDMPDGPKTVDGVAADPAGGRGAWFVDSEQNIVNLVELPPAFRR